ncbi:MAG: PD-(D/E)XK nuclease family protein [Rickettsiaceae bacterium]
MNLYIVKTQDAFLEVLADLVIDKFHANFANLKILLPSGRSCTKLQELLIEKLSITTLPQIIPYYNIASNYEENDSLQERLSSREMNLINTLEVKIILSEIINGYKSLNFNIAQSMQSAVSLYHLFQELEYNDVDIEQLKDLPTLNQSEHWQLIYNFLQYAYHQFQIKLKSLDKISLAAYHKKHLSLEATRLFNNPSQILIIAGIMGNNKIAWNFLNQVAQNKNGHIILSNIPTSIVENQKRENDRLEIHNNALYCFQSLLKILKKDVTDFAIIGDKNIPKNSILDKMILSDIPYIAEKDPIKNKITHYQCDNIFASSILVSKICNENKDSQIAIILNNSNTKDYYANLLLRYDLSFNDFFGTCLDSSNIIHIITCISTLMIDGFDMQVIFKLFKNPILYSPVIIALETLLTKNKVFVTNYDQLGSVINAQNESNRDEDLELFFDKIGEIFKYQHHYKDHSLTINQILYNAIKIAEQLCPTLWARKDAKIVSDFLSQLLRFKCNIKITNSHDLRQVIKQLSSDFFFNESDASANIVICSPQHAVMSKFDLVIIPDFIEGNWPSANQINPWINPNMKNELQLYSSQIADSILLYNFYLLLHNPRIYLIGLNKNANDAFANISTYWLKLQLLYQEQKHSNIESIKYHHPEYQVGQSSDKENEDSSDIIINHFPDSISATDIELLVRNPYGFYAKKILRLNKTNVVRLEPELADFGNFIHKVIEDYSISYNKISKNTCYDKLLSIGQQTIAKKLLPKHIQKIWMLKLENIAQEFIEFDTQRRKKAKYLYCEVQGHYDMNILNQNVRIKAIADRIEVDDNEVATIIDYKTGAIPSKKHVMTGLSPQLIIESIIAINGGFGFKVNCVEELLYVKIGSSEPYIETTSIDMNKVDIDSQITGLVNLLEYYMRNKIFTTTIDLTRYNNYKHLSRIV